MLLLYFVLFRSPTPCKRWAGAAAARLPPPRSLHPRCDSRASRSRRHSRLDTVGFSGGISSRKTEVGCQWLCLPCTVQILLRGTPPSYSLYDSSKRLCNHPGSDEGERGRGASLSEMALCTTGRSPGSICTYPWSASHLSMGLEWA